MNHDVGSVLNGLHQNGGKRIIDDEEHLMAVGHLGNGLQVCHIGVRIAQRLGKDDLCVGLNGAL